MAQQPLEDIFEGKEPVVEQVATEEPQEEAVTEEAVPVEEPTEDTPEVEATEETKVVEEAEPTSAKKSIDKEVPLTALLDERDKRKAAQEELEQLKAAQVEPEKDFWENPEAAVAAQVNAVKSELQSQYQNGYIALSMQYSSSFHDDFDEAKDAFAQAAQQNPALADQALSAEMPGEYIYKTGKQFMQLDAVGGDVDSLRDSIRNEERAKLMAELKENDNKLASVPKPITDETSAMAPREKVESGPTPLENIFSTNT